MTDDDIIRMAEDAGTTYVTGHGVASAKIEWLRGFAARVAAREREACAKVCDMIAADYYGSPAGTGADNCAYAIRARGEK